MPLPTISYVIDDDYTILSFNKAAAEAYPQLKMGEKCHKCLSGLDTPCPPCPVANHVIGPRTYFDPIRKIGETVDAVDLPFPDGRLAHALVISASEDDKSLISELDQQTGLLNRFGLLRYCEEFVPDSLDQRVGMIAFCISGFEELIYQYGHDIAKEVVNFVARGIELPGAKIAYFGVGLFVGFLQLSDSEEPPDIPKLIEMLENDAPVAGVEIKAGLFTGTFADGPLPTLFEYAEAALDSIRGFSGQNFKRVTLDSYRKLASEREKLSKVLKAIDNDEFDIYLQPKCQISTGAVVGSEALARWIKPDGSVVSPGVFVPLLERNGLISRLDVVVWERVFSKVADWKSRGVDTLPISVNVSREDIEQLDVASIFQVLSESYDVEPHYIEIEITESAYVDDEGIIRLAEEKLQEAGFRVLIDDFSSGYSALSMLKDVNADVLKLDMGFLNYDERDQSRATEIVYSVLAMAHQLDMYVVVEGVETKEQADLLNALGCQFAQGFYFYKPMPCDQFEELLERTGTAKIPDNQRLGHKSSVQRLAECFWRLAEVDINTGAYHFIRNIPEPSSIAVPRPATMEEYSERYIEQGYIHPDDIQRYRRATNLAALRYDIAHGARRERNSFRFLEDDGSWQWYVLEVVLTEEFSAKEPWVLFAWRQAADDIGRREDVEALARSMYSQIYRLNLETMECETAVGKARTRDVEYRDGIPTFVDLAVASGRIHPDDAAAVLAFSNIESLRRHFEFGGRSHSLIFRVKGDNGWISYIAEAARSVDFSEGNPVIVMTLREAKVAASEAEARRSVENASMRALFDASRETSLYEFIFNASQDKVVYDSARESSGVELALHTGATFSDVVEQLAYNTMPTKDAERYLRVLNSQRLVRLYQSGAHYDQLEYQREFEGELRWMRVVLHLYSPEDSDEVWGNGVVTDIQEDVHDRKLEGNVYMEGDGKEVVFDTMQLLESIPGGFFVYEAYGDKRILYANGEVLRIFRCETPEELRELTNGSFRGMIHPDDLESVESIIETQIADDRAHNDQLLDYVSYRIVRRDGQSVWVQDFGRQLCHDSRGTIYSVFISEVADARMDAYRIAHRMGFTDMLCDMLNRNSFEQRKNYVDNVKGSATCVFIDLNGLHELNNEKGHDAGDEALIKVANAVKEAFGENDSFRIGGDEFVALVRGKDEGWGQELAEGVKAALVEQGVNVSCGSAHVENLTDVSALVTEAEANMRADKRAFYAAGRNRRH